MSNSHEPERFHVRLDGTRVVRLTVAEMTPEDLRLAVASAERELQLMQQHAVPALALLQRVADGDQSVLQWELHRAREMAETLVRVQQQTDRLRAAVRIIATTTEGRPAQQ